MDDEGESITEVEQIKNQPNIYGEYSREQLFDLSNRLPRTLCGKCYNYINQGKPEEAIKILKDKKII